jgi:hypothetical protein
MTGGTMRVASLLASLLFALAGCRGVDLGHPEGAINLVVSNQGAPEAAIYAAPCGNATCLKRLGGLAGGDSARFLVRERLWHGRELQLYARLSGGRLETAAPVLLHTDEYVRFVVAAIPGASAATVAALSTCGKVCR